MDSIGCAICHKSFNHKRDCVITLCGHLFDQNCIKVWLERSPACPICRSPLIIGELKKVFFSLVPATTLEQPAKLDVEEWKKKEANTTRKIGELRRDFNALRDELT